jgi:hypothetical protein
MHKQDPELRRNYKNVKNIIGIGWITLVTLGASIFFFLKKRYPKLRRVPGKKIDIEIRYETEKDADSTLLAQNIVKVIRMVLVPLEKQIEKENAKLIFVFGGDFWEMRLRNASKPLKNSVAQLLESKEW